MGNAGRGAGGERRAWPSLACAILALAVHAPLLSNGFVNYDDPSYVTDNPRVREGLSAAAVAWALTHPLDGNWHPLTVLSHMADVTIWGLRPAGHHGTSLALHAANAALLALLLLRLSDRPWPSFFGAALFAVHPLNVQSIAWIAERKNPLSTLFWLLALLAWLSHARRPRAASYLGALALATLALASKPMAVTLPVTLLLVDALVLDQRRRRGESARALAARLVVEKLPFFAVAAAIAVATLRAQAAEGNVAALAAYPLAVRGANAVESAAWYLVKSVFPTGLAVFYPHPGASIAAARLFGSALLLAAVTAAAVRAGRGAAIAWTWYLVTLLPVLGLVQAGAQARADRYAYVPLIGLFAAGSLGIDAVASRSRRLARAATVAGFVSIAVLSAASVRAGSAWKNSVSLFERSVAVSPDEPIALVNLGAALAERGRLGEAVATLSRAAELHPDDPAARLNLGNALALAGRAREAEQSWTAASRLDPLDARAPYNLGVLLLREGRPREAAESLREALRRDPSHERARSLLDRLERRGDRRGPGG